jgi:beta-lactamase regulating signal transducer with metallopeptidase domain
MPALFSYLIKLSIGLAVVALFYQLVLRRLTFYNWNRWYLFAYTIACFFIPFIDINPILHNNEWTDTSLVQLIPIINDNPAALSNNTGAVHFNYWNIAIILLATGATIMLCRLLIQLISFRRMMKKAELISGDNLKVYQVNESIIPFSFGNSVFINRNLHTAEELQEIIRHEFVHARQKHSLDIIWSELLCMLNWYNPFVWLLRKSIRQNLEFIADNNVVENGIDKKEYQYLLLKVIGNSQFSIATQFNFSSLKKRIAMMNKTKSAKRQLLRMLFLLPATAVLLLAFRNKMDAFENRGQEQPPVKTREAIFRDTVPEVMSPNSKGYIINIKDKSGECEVVIKDKDKKEVKRLLLTEWNEKADYYENLYGEIPPPPPTALPSHEQWVKAANPDVKSVSVNNNFARVTLKNGKTENYDLNNAAEKKTFESKYGELPEPPLPPLPLHTPPSKTAKPGEPATPPVPPAPPSKVIGVKPNEGVKADFDLKDNVITVTPKNGIKEVYDLKNDKEKKQFTEKYGEPVVVSDITTSVNSNINTNVNAVLATTLKSDIVANNNINAVTVASTNLNTKIAADNVINAKLATTVSSPAVVNLKTDVATTVSPAIATNVDVDIMITITKNTSQTELEKLITKLKEKGYDLKFTNKNYNDGILTTISGVIKYKASSSTFSVTDFNDVTIAVFRDGDKVSFKILTDIKKTVI